MNHDLPFSQGRYAIRTYVRASYVHTYVVDAVRYRGYVRGTIDVDAKLVMYDATPQLDTDTPSSVRTVTSGRADMISLETYTYVCTQVYWAAVISYIVTQCKPHHLPSFSMIQPVSNDVLNTWVVSLSLDQRTSVHTVRTPYILYVLRTYCTYSVQYGILYPRTERTHVLVR